MRTIRMGKRAEEDENRFSALVKLILIITVIGIIAYIVQQIMNSVLS